MDPTVILTASAGSFPGLVEALREIPIAVEERPLLRFGPPDNWAPLDTALNSWGRYGAVAFTSPRAARVVLERLRLLRRPTGDRPARPELWAVGPATGAPLQAELGPVRVPPGQPQQHTAAILAQAMLDANVRGPVLFPCGETRRDELAAGLRAGGIEVDEVVCYRSVLADESEARAAAARGSVLVVASPTVVDLLARACPQQRPELLAVGPTTAASARAAGWSPAAVAAEPSSGALASAIRHLLLKR